MSAGESKSKRPRAGQPKPSAARKRAAQAVSLTSALAEASWTEADAALADALADFDEVESARGKARDQALAFLSQSLSRAARKRGLTRLGDLGARVRYDEAGHELTSAVAKAPKTVRIQARGVARAGEVLTKPRVTPLQRKKKRP